MESIGLSGEIQPTLSEFEKQELALCQQLAKVSASAAVAMGAAVLCSRKLGVLTKSERAYQPLRQLSRPVTHGGTRCAATPAERAT